MIIYFLSDSNNRVRKITKAGVVTNFAGGTSAYPYATRTNVRFRNPLPILTDRYNNICVSEFIDRRIRKITPQRVVTTVAGSSANSRNDGIKTSASFRDPWAMAIDPYDNLFVGDGNRIRKINEEGIVVSILGLTIGGINDGPASQATFDAPNGAVFDQYNNLYISEAVRHVIRKITPSGFVSRIAGTGSTGTTDGIGNLAAFNNPTSIGYDSVNSCLYLTDRLNGRVRIITIYPVDPVPYNNITTGLIQTNTSIGSIGFTGQFTLVPI